MNIVCGLPCQHASVNKILTIPKNYIKNFSSKTIHRHNNISIKIISLPLSHCSSYDCILWFFHFHFHFHNCNFFPSITLRSTDTAYANAIYALMNPEDMKINDYGEREREGGRRGRVEIYFYCFDLLVFECEKNSMKMLKKIF